MAVVIPRLPVSLSSSPSPAMASWFTQRRPAGSNYLPPPVWQQHSVSSASSAWSSTVPQVQYSGSEYLVEANEYASSSDDFMDQYVESPKSVGEVRSPTPAVLYSLPETFDPRGSQAQESAVKAEPSATDAFVFDSATTPCPVSTSQWSSCSQVPLRATQATPEMRAMMGVFRIDPFAFVGGPPPPSDAGPLTAPGKHFEWQLPTDAPQERAPQEVYDAPHEMQSARNDVVSEMVDPSYGYPLSTLPPRRPAPQAHAHSYDPPSYHGSSSGSYPSSRSYVSTPAKVEYGFPLSETTRDAQASWTSYPRVSTASSAGGSRPGTSGTGYSETYQEVHTADMSSARYAPAQRHSYDEPQPSYYHGHGSGAFY
ncbi:hypothetical protein PENSPDRAFT_731133 [Peniophora sp. CONT]|nr:hypothetical protein PENSPDRAFT_731133 [Peniophora sp. CONT]